MLRSFMIFLFVFFGTMKFYELIHPNLKLSYEVLWNSFFFTVNLTGAIFWYKQK